MIEQSAITKETHGTGGSFNYSANGDTAKLAFSRASDTLVIASSTTVPDSMRGQGAGEALLTAFINDAKANGYKIMPLCPFVKARGPLREDWSEVVSG